jgi:hypothetical protein
VRPIILFRHSAETSLSSFAIRCVASTRSSPRFRPVESRSAIGSTGDRRALALLRREEVRLVDHDEAVLPQRARELISVDELRHVLLLLAERHLGQVDHGRQPELEELRREQLRAARVAATSPSLPGEHVGEALAQRGELALAIEHDVLHAAVRLLEQVAHGPRLPAAAVRLDEQLRLDEAIERDGSSTSSALTLGSFVTAAIPIGFAASIERRIVSRRTATARSASTSAFSGLGAADAALTSAPRGE